MSLAKKGFVFNLFNYVLFIVLGVITLYPFWDVLVGSMIPYSDYVRNPVRLFPVNFTLEAYKGFFFDNDFLNPLKNTLFLTITGTAISILVTTMAAYALSRKVMQGRTFIMYMIVFTMLFSGGLIPLYVILRMLHLIDSLWGLVLLGSCNTFYLLVMKSYFSGIPDSIEESAMIDGAGYFQILFRIIAPMSMPIIATMILFYAVDKWNELYGALIFIHSDSKKLLQVMLYKLIYTSKEVTTISYTYSSKANITPQTQRMAAVIVTTVPILAVYPFLQKYFAKGVMIGAIKG
jgi:putative aldouronate transport system permease protein